MASNEYDSINAPKDDAKSEISIKQKFLAELIGTAFLVFIVTGIPVFSQKYPEYVYNGSFEAAFVLTVMIFIFGRIS